MGFYRFARALILGVCSLLFRVRVRGREHVPASGPYVLAPTHRSILDIPFAAYVTRRRVRFMGKKELWESRLGALVFSALGGFPVDRAAGTAAVKAALSVLAAGEPVVVFPEGTRREGTRIEGLHQGAAYLAVKTAVPIVPVGIGGSEAILARGKVIPRLRRVAVVVGEPLVPKQPEKTFDRDDVRRLTHELEGELQRLFDRAFALAGSA